MTTKKNAINPYAKMKINDLVVTAVQLKESLDEANASIKTLKQALGEANDVIRSDLRSRKVSELLKTSDFTVEDLNGQGLEELDTMLKIIGMAKKPFKSVSDTSSPGNDSHQKLQSMYAYNKK